METYGLFFLVAFAIGGVAWVLLYPILSGERKAERRMASVARSEPAARPTRGVPKPRREQIEGTLKELEQRQKKAKSPPLSVRLGQAGLNWSKRKYITISVILGFVAFLIGFLLSHGLLPTLAFGFAGGFGIPRWLLKFLKIGARRSFSMGCQTRSTSSCAASRPACRCSTA